MVVVAGGDGELCWPLDLTSEQNRTTSRHRSTAKRIHGLRFHHSNTYLLWAMAYIAQVADPFWWSRASPGPWARCVITLPTATCPSSPPPGSCGRKRHCTSLHVSTLRPHTSVRSEVGMVNSIFQKNPSHLRHFKSDPISLPTTAPGHLPLLDFLPRRRDQNPAASAPSNPIPGTNSAIFAYISCSTDII